MWGGGGREHSSFRCKGFPHLAVLEVLEVHLMNPCRTASAFFGTYYLDLVWDNLCSSKSDGWEALQWKGML